MADTFWGIGNTSGKIFTKEDIGEKYNHRVIRKPRRL